MSGKSGKYDDSRDIGTITLLCWIIAGLLLLGLVGYDDLERRCEVEAFAASHVAVTADNGEMVLVATR